MRTIKFRGKSICEDVITTKDSRIAQGDWAYGSLIVDTQPYIVGEIADVDREFIAPEFWIPVDKNTIGQFTGLYDKNGVEIYEGDIVVSDFFTWEGKCIVKFGDYYNEEIWESSRNGYGWFTEMLNGEPSSRRELNNDTLEVIGNIHEVKE